MTVHNYSNTASQATLDAPLNSSANSFTVSDFTGFPQAPFYILMDRDTSSSELMEVTGVAGSTLTVQRGQGGTASTSHSAGAVVEHVIPAQVPQAVEQHIEATSNVHGVTGALIGADSVGSLTNKTFEGAFVHSYSASQPSNPEGGFVVNADNSTARDGFIADGDGANTDRRGFLLSQGGAERVEIFYDGTVRVTPSGSAVRPGIESTTSVRCADADVTDDLTVGGDGTVAGTLQSAALSTGNLTTSGTASVGGATTVQALTAQQAIAANGSGTGLTVANAADVGTLNVTNGNLTLQGSNARLGFPSNPTAGNAGTAIGQTRYRASGLEIWNGSAWLWQGGQFGTTFDTLEAPTGTYTQGTIELRNETFTGFLSGAPYKLAVQGQCELSDVTPGARFDLLVRLDSATTGDLITVGIGHSGFATTPLGVTDRLTGTHTIHWVASRTIGGSGSVTLNNFNVVFTYFVLPATE